MRKLHTLGGVASCAIVLAAGTRAQTPLLTPAPANAQVLAWDAVQRRGDPAIVETRFVRVATAELEALRVQRRLDPVFSVDLFGDIEQVSVREIRPGLRHVYFLAGMKSHADSLFSLAMLDDGATAGSFEFDDQRFQLSYTGVGDIHALQRLDPESKSYLPCGTDHTHVITSPPELFGGAPTLAASATGTATIIDVMVYYTPAVRQSSGGTSAIQSTIALRVGNATTGSQACGVDECFRLTYTAETNYTETGTSTDLSRFRGNGDGFMDEVHTDRNLYGGDVMSLVINNSSQFCGVGYLMGNVSTGFRTQAFSVTVRSCLAQHTMTHEMGHNMGSHHDRPNASGTPAYSYSYGFRTSNNQYRSIMAYSPGSRVNRWSGPTITWAGLSLGNAQNDNARSLTNTKATVRNFWSTRTYEWSAEGGGIAGLVGVPSLSGAGTTGPTIPVTVTPGNARVGAPGALAIGSTAINTPLFGGTLVPSPDYVIPVVGASPTGTPIDVSVVRSLASGSAVWFQAFYLDANAVQGISASDGLRLDIP